MSKPIYNQRFELSCFSEGGDASGIEVELALAKTGNCKLQYRLNGDIRSLSVPEASEDVRQDGLWQHTCFELFIACRDHSYLEFNFSPSKKWAVYQFESYREGMSKPDLESSPKIAVQTTKNSLVLNTVINLQHLLITDSLSQYQIAVAAVIESRSGNLSYWALKHPSEHPDFHHPDGFVPMLSDNGG